MLNILCDKILFPSIKLLIAPKHRAQIQLHSDIATHEIPCVRM